MATVQRQSEVEPSRGPERWSRRVGIVLLGVCGVMLLVLWPLACTTVVVPPPTPADSVLVLLVDHGRTPLVVLPGPQGEMVAYAYGDWHWYALEETTVWRGIAAMCWPTPGALGRRRLPASPTAKNYRQHARVGAVQVYEIQVSRRLAEQLRQRLDRLYQQQAATKTFSEASRLHFVHHLDGYHYFHNSNHVAASWLRALGCQVHGPAFYSRWEIRPHR